MSSFDSNLIEMSVCIEISQNMFYFLQHSITIILQVACSFAHNFCSVCSIFPITPIYSLHSIMFFSHTTTTHTIPSGIRITKKEYYLNIFHMNSIVWCLAMLGIQIISLMSQEEKEIILFSVLKSLFLLTPALPSRC